MLHGDIYDTASDSRIVGWWEAVRIDGGTEPDDINTYDCAAGRHPKGGERSWHIWRGKIKHRYGDGAAVLASKILTESSKEETK